MQNGDEAFCSRAIAFAPRKERFRHANGITFCRGPGPRSRRLRSTSSTSNTCRRCPSGLSARCGGELGRAESAAGRQMTYGTEPLPCRSRDVAGSAAGDSSARTDGTAIVPRNPDDTLRNEKRNTNRLGAARCDRRSPRNARRNSNAGRSPAPAVRGQVVAAVSDLIDGARHEVLGPPRRSGCRRSHRPSESRPGSSNQVLRTRQPAHAPRESHPENDWREPRFRDPPRPGSTDQTECPPSAMCPRQPD